ncbi:Lariat debranching enzyme [Penicillium rolfsii]|nr:Lariat debranching enzyme [Penicillium rolfsii]
MVLSEILGIRVAVVGCAHGAFKEIYGILESEARAKGWETIDLVIIGGDFQALRNSNDAACISVPAKYKSMGDFHEFYEGTSVAPYLTIFCGGNHEASNYMYELYYGGWAAPNIYYLGAANVVKFGPLRISAMSGIWKGYDYRKPHFERIPYSADDLHSIHHIRELDVRKLLQIRTQVDIGLSHDWPRGIEYFGNHQELFRKKRGFREDSEHGKLGNVAARDVLDRLRPAYWFSAHLHVKFAATVPHDGVTLKPISLPVDQPAVWAFEAQTVADSPKPESSTMISAQIPTSPGHTASNEQVTSTPKAMISNQIAPASGTSQDKLNAWNNFAAGGARAFEAQERIQIENNFAILRREQELRAQSQNDTPVRANVDQTAPGINQDEIDLDSGSDSEETAIANLSTVKTNQDEIDLDSGSETGKTASGNPSPIKAPKLNIASTDGSSDQTASEPLLDQAVIEGIRGRLPDSFFQPVAAIKSTPKKTIPAAITNKITRFLALDKPHNKDPFMHLVNINPIEPPGENVLPGPFRLEYDREWLAITRVFANDLILGDITAKVPADQGEDYYRSRISEEEKWVEENVLQMEVPYNFQPSAPNYDSSVPLSTTEQPKEYTNSQTAEFCKMLQIPNLFDLSETERQARMEAGPRSVGPGYGGRGGGHRGGGHRGGGRGRGGRGRGVGRGRGANHAW